MKYFFRVLIVLLVAVGIALFIYSSNYREKAEKEQITLTTVKIGEHTSKENIRQLIAENTEGDYQLYTENGSVILCHAGKEQAFDWYTSVTTKTPELYYFDFDEDGEKELGIILANSTITNGSNDYSNALVVVEESNEPDAAKPFVCLTAGMDTWKVPFSRAIKCEMSQPVNNKFIQFVMDNSSAQFTYDEATGFSSNKYVYFAKAQTDNNGNYASFDRWTKGVTKYSVNDNGKISLSIQVLVYYKELAVPQKAGSIKMKISLKENDFDIVPNTIKFVASKEYFCPDPRERAQEQWTSVIHNSANASSINDTQISWLEAQFALNTPYTETTISFSDMESQIKNVDTVELCENSVTIYAKENYTFSDTALKSKKYSVIISIDDKTEYDISDKCELSNETGTGVLKIYFDNAYSREALAGVRIKYGA